MTHEGEYLRFGDMVFTPSGRYISGRGFFVGSEGSDEWYIGAGYSPVCYADGSGKVYELSKILPEGVHASVKKPFGEIRDELLAVKYSLDGYEECEVCFNTFGVMEQFIVEEKDFFKALARLREYLKQEDEKRLQKASQQLQQFLQQHSTHTAWQETECNKYLYMYKELEKQGYFQSDGYKLIVLQEYFTTRGNTSFILSIVPANAKEATIAVPKRYVGLVIGRGGENIRSVQKKLNMRIKIQEV